MNWYLAKVVFHIVTGLQHTTAQFEDQLRLIYANDEDEAFTKACEIGKNEQLHFINQSRHLIQWKFVNVSELYLISDFIDGAEVYSAVSEMSCEESFIRLVNDKSAMIKNKESRKQLNLM